MLIFIQQNTATEIDPNQVIEEFKQLTERENHIFKLNFFAKIIYKNCLIHDTQIQVQMCYLSKYVFFSFF